MTTNLTCRKCARAVSGSYRYCPYCGAEVHTAFNEENARPEAFIELLNSLYNLLADKASPVRRHYLPQISEDVMSRRATLEFNDEFGRFFATFAAHGGMPQSVSDLLTVSLSNALTGYAYRSVEEAVMRKRSSALSPTESERLLSSMRVEAGSSLRDSCFAVLDEKKAVDLRLLRCLALRWDNRHLPYLLADDSVQRKWIATVMSQNIDSTIKRHEAALIDMQSGDIRSLMHRKLPAIADNVEQDVIFGYIVKLSESLWPM